MADLICQDGPAREVGLSGVKRLPRYLRIVRHRETGKWDALDALDDEPASEEEVHVYRRASLGFVCARGSGRSARVGIYEHVEVRLAERRRLRETEAWREWADAQP